MKLCIFCGNGNETYAPFCSVRCFFKWRGKKIVD